MGLKLNSLTSGRVLARSAFWNLAGMAAPMLVALFAIPLLIDGMGKERFGLLAVIWMGVGYFSLFDLGLGRALTKLVSERLGSGFEEDLGSLIWTSLLMLAGLSIIGATVLIFLSPALVMTVLQVPEALDHEAIVAFRVLAIGVPIVVLTAGLVGLLEAHQRFGTIAAIRVPLGVLTFLGPLFTLQFTPSIAWAALALLLGRFVALVAYYSTAVRVQRELRSPQWLEKSHVQPLLSFGGWLTVTNIIGPLMTSLDRFFIGAQLGMSSVTYYVTPYEVLSRLQMLPGAIVGVLFPAMAAAQGAGTRRFTELYLNGSRVMYWAMLPLTVGGFLLAPEALLLWLGPDFSEVSTPVAQWLAAGWMINTLARPAFTALQASGRPDLVAKAHMAELLPYLGLLWWLAATHGIAGVAAAWTLRVVADTIILQCMVAVTVPSLRALVIRGGAALLGTGVLFASFLLIDSLPPRLTILLIVAGVAVSMLWPVFRLAILGGLSPHAKKLEQSRGDI